MHIDNIRSSIYEIIHWTGLPLWMLIIILVAWVGILYFYALRVPLAIFAIRKELVCQSKLFETVINMAKRNSKKQSSRYHYRE